MTLPVAILAGGLATRMRPATETIPKALLPVGGRPFIAHQLAYLRRQGVRDVVLCVGHLGEQVREFVGDGASWDLHVQYSFDGPVLMGTGGALAAAAPLLGEQFFVLYGDSYLPVDFSPVEEAFVKSGMPALMTVLKNENRWDKSNVLFADGTVLRYDKRAPSGDMRHIDYGLGVLSCGILAGLPAQPFDLADIYHRLSVEGRLAGFEVHQRFYEIGSPEGLQETDIHLREGTSQ